VDSNRGQVKFTAKDLWNLTREDSKWERYELDDGELVEMPLAGARQGLIQATMVTSLGRFLEDKALGVGMSGRVGFELSRECVRASDIAFLSSARLSAVPIPEEGFYSGPPDLAIEVRSPSDTGAEIFRKVSQFLEAGTRLAWVVDPKKKTVTVYHPDGDVEVLHEGDTLVGEPILPGFSMLVAELFV